MAGSPKKRARREAALRAQSPRAIIASLLKSRKNTLEKYSLEEVLVAIHWRIIQKLLTTFDDGKHRAQDPEYARALKILAEAIRDAKRQRSEAPISTEAAEVCAREIASALRDAANWSDIACPEGVVPS